MIVRAVVGLTSLGIFFYCMYPALQKALSLGGKDLRMLWGAFSLLIFLFCFMFPDEESHE